MDLRNLDLLNKYKDKLNIASDQQEKTSNSKFNVFKGIYLEKLFRRKDYQHSYRSGDCNE